MTFVAARAKLFNLLESIRKSALICCCCCCCLLMRLKIYFHSCFSLVRFSLRKQSDDASFCSTRLGRACVVQAAQHRRGVSFCSVHQRHLLAGSHFSSVGQWWRTCPQWGHEISRSQVACDEQTPLYKLHNKLYLCVYTWLLVQWV